MDTFSNKAWTRLVIKHGDVW